MTAHWGIEDHCCGRRKAITEEKSAHFVTAFKYLKNRISVFVSLPIQSLDKMALRGKLREIGRLDGTTARADEVQ